MPSQNQPERLNIDDLFGTAGSEGASNGVANSTPGMTPAPPAHTVPADPTPSPFMYPREEKKKSIIETAITYIAFAALAFFIVSWITGHRGSTPDNDDQTSVTIKVPGPTVLVTYGEGQSINDGQKNVLNTTKVQTWCEENGITYRRFEATADLSKAEPYWKLMQQAASDPPAMTIALPSGKVIKGSLPDTIEKAIAKIEKETK